MQKTETSLFDGIDTSITGLAQYAAPNPPSILTSGLASIVDAAQVLAEAGKTGKIVVQS